MPLDIQATLSRFADLNIVVIGDIMLDHYIMGDATRISPEAPVPVVSVSHDKYVPGGAANVGNNFVGLGVPTTLIGSFCDDPESQLLKKVLAMENRPAQCEDALEPKTRLYSDFEE